MDPLAIIGGSGFETLPGLAIDAARTADTAYGVTSAPLTRGRLAGLPLLFLALLAGTLISLGICVAELNDHERSRDLLNSVLARLDESGLDSPDLRSLALNTLSGLESVSPQ